MLIGGPHVEILLIQEVSENAILITENNNKLIFDGKKNNQLKLYSYPTSRNDITNPQWIARETVFIAKTRMSSR